MTKYKVNIFVLVAGYTLVACSPANDFTPTTEIPVETLTTINIQEVLPTAGSATKIRQAEENQFETEDETDYDLETTNVKTDINDLKGTITSGNKYYLSQGLYKFSIKPEYGYSGIHVYNKDGVEVISHILLIDPDNNINNNEVTVDIPDDTYVVATLVDFEKL